MLRAPLALLVTAAVLSVVPACATTETPQPPTSTTASTAATTSAPPQAHGVYEQCLTQHGVPSPAAGPPPGPVLEPQGPLPGPPAESTPGSTTPPPPPPPGVDPGTWDNAVHACASLQPSPPTNTP